MLPDASAITQDHSTILWQSCLCQQGICQGIFLYTGPWGSWAGLRLHNINNTRWRYTLVRMVDAGLFFSPDVLSVSSLISDNQGTLGKLRECACLPTRAAAAPDIGLGGSGAWGSWCLYWCTGPAMGVYDDRHTRPATSAKRVWQQAAMDSEGANKGSVGPGVEHLIGRYRLSQF